MATQRIGGVGPVFGTVDETEAIFENIEVTTDVEETELLDGDSDVYAVDQHTKRQRVTGEYTFLAAGEVVAADVGSGSIVTINSSDSTYGAIRAYIRSFSNARSKGDYMKRRFEGTAWLPLIS